MEVARAAWDAGLADAEQPEDLQQMIADLMFDPEY